MLLHSKKEVNMTIKVTKEQINKIFEGSKDQADACVGLYKLAFPDWNNINKIDGWPKIGQEMAEYLFRKWTEFDRKHHPDVMAGGLWLNKGFCTLNNDHLEWEIDISQVKLTYHGEIEHSSEKSSG